ncbi:MAG: thioredoxin [Clostridia bacterium]|jgi:thioredoxin 1|nr:thioredoxin [Clostridia bacterium]
MEQIQSKDFKSRVLENKKPVLVDFYANWCGPCKMLTPILEQVIEESNGEFEIIKIDVDECEDLSREFGIMSIPTLIVFKNGKPVKKEIGLRNKSAIIEMMKI